MGVNNDKLKSSPGIMFIGVDPFYSDWEVAMSLAFRGFVIKSKPIRTQSELDNERLTEIVDAITRYRQAEMAVPTQWIEEYNTIIERIKNNPK